MKIIKIRKCLRVLVLLTYMIGSYPANYYCMKHDLVGYNRVEANAIVKKKHGGHLDRALSLLLSPVALPLTAFMHSVEYFADQTVDMETIRQELAEGES